MLTPSQQHRQQSNLKIKLNQRVGAWLAQGEWCCYRDASSDPSSAVSDLARRTHWTQLAVFLGGKTVRDCVLVAVVATSTRWWLGSVCEPQRLSYALSVKLLLLGEKQMACITRCLFGVTVYTLARPIAGVRSDRHCCGVGHLNWDKSAYYNGGVKPG